MSEVPGKVYTVVTYRSVSNEAALAAYGALAGPAIKAGGGRIIARGMPAGQARGNLARRLASYFGRGRRCRIWVAE